MGRQSVATQQLMEIARALVSDAEIILFDEPTSSLAAKRCGPAVRDRPQTERLGDRHRLHQPLSWRRSARSPTRTPSFVTDDNVGSGRIAEVSDDQIVSLMVGRDVDDLFPSVPHHARRHPWVESIGLHGSPYPAASTCLAAARRDLWRRRLGWRGPNRVTTLPSLGSITSTPGVVDPSTGEQIRGESVRARMKAGFGLLSEDRKNEGLAQDLSIVENITDGPARSDYTTMGVINLQTRQGQRAESVDDAIVAVKAHSGSIRLGTFRGATSRRSRSRGSFINKPTS